MASAAGTEKQSLKFPKVWRKKKPLIQIAFNAVVYAEGWGGTFGTDHFSMPELENREKFSSYQDPSLQLDSGDALES